MRQLFALRTAVPFSKHLHCKGQVIIMDEISQSAIERASVESEQFGGDATDIDAPMDGYINNFPEAVRANCWWVLTAAGVFAGAICISFTLTRHREPLPRPLRSAPAMRVVHDSRASNDDADRVNMLIPQVSLAQVIIHNLTAGIYLTILGVSFGIGTIVFLVLNGLTIGSLLAMLTASVSPLMLAACLLPHAVIEIPGFCIAGAAGLRIGSGLARAIARGRFHHVQVALWEAAYLTGGAVVLLIIAAFIESLISFTVGIQPIMKFLFAGASAITLLAYLSCAHRRK